jgi:RNA polymerase sigma-70 factor (ECF subfamily)
VTTFPVVSRGEREDELVRGLVRGDRRAWETLCETYAGPLYVYAYHRTGGDRHTAEDVRQETLLAAAEGMASYSGDVPLFSWLCGIARHKAVDLVKQARRQGTPVDPAAISGPGVEGTPFEVARPPVTAGRVRANPDEQAEESAALVEALWGLPANYRDALLARYRDGDSVSDIAAQTGRSYKATESLLSRAKEALRSRLAEVDGDE